MQLEAILRWIFRLYNYRRNHETGTFLAPSLVELHREGHRLKAIYWRCTLSEVGDRVIFWDGLKVMGPSKIRIGAGATIASKVVLDGRGGLSIGSWALVGFDSVILTSTHRFSNASVPIRQQGMESGSVSVGDNVWIGARTMILPGVTIGDNAVVGAMSLVTRDIPADVVAAGIPARVLRTREEQQACVPTPE